MPAAPPPDAPRAAARLLLEQLAFAGVAWAPRAEDHQAAAAGPPAAPLDLDQAIRSCQACPLAQGRQQAVPGEGPTPATLMLVGEAPGADEDRSGRPFVGAAGQLLDRILTGGMGLRREQVYITNTVKCRPPGNRNPTPAEIAACAHYLDAQVAAVQPRLILALGKVAATRLLGREEALSRLRGKIHQPWPDGPAVVVTYHPAYLLRQPTQKAACWQDIQLAMAHLGLPRP